MTWHERVLKINKVIWTTKLRVIHTQISIPKQYQMIMSSVARVEFIKTKVIFMYHTKDVSNQVHYNSDHEIKSYSCSNSTTKMGKKKRFQIRAGISNRGKEILNLGRDYKSRQGGFQNGAGKDFDTPMLKIWNICAWANCDYSLLDAYWKVASMICNWNLHWGWPLINIAGQWFQQLDQVIFSKIIFWSVNLTLPF